VRSGLALGVAILSLLTTAARGGYHQRGSLSLSLGGSFAHTSYKNRAQNYEAEVTGEVSDTQYVSQPIDYTDLDFSLYLSAGYFVTEHVELGLSGSTMLTLYPEDNQEDLEIYDVTGYAKYHFDNRTRWTPYVQLEGGATFLETGTYTETGTIGGGSLGLEFLGMGSFSWYVELSTEYRDNGGDLTGTEWRNQIYIGISFYPNLLRKRGEAAAGLPAGEIPPPERQIDPETGLHPAQVEALRQMGVDISALKAQKQGQPTEPEAAEPAMQPPAGETPEPAPLPEAPALLPQPEAPEAPSAPAVPAIPNARPIMSDPRAPVPRR
jgi:hypothetical protein